MPRNRALVLAAWLVACGCDEAVPSGPPDVGTMVAAYRFDSAVDWGRPTAWLERPSEGAGYVVGLMPDGRLRAILRGRLDAGPTAPLERIDVVLATGVPAADFVVADVDEDGDDDLLVHGRGDTPSRLTRDRLWLATRMDAMATLVVDMPGSSDFICAEPFRCFFSVLGDGDAVAVVVPVDGAPSYVVTRSWLRERTAVVTDATGLRTLTSSAAPFRGHDVVAVNRGDAFQLASVRVTVVAAHDSRYAMRQTLCRPSAAGYECEADGPGFDVPRYTQGWATGALLPDGALAYVQGGGLGSAGREPVHVLWSDRSRYSGTLEWGSWFAPAAVRLRDDRVLVLGTFPDRDVGGVWPYVIEVTATSARTLGRLRSIYGGQVVLLPLDVRDNTTEHAVVLARVDFDGFASSHATRVDLISAAF